MSVPRITVGVEAVVRVLLEQPDTELYGLEIMKAAKLEAGTAYPILQRLRGAGWLAARWEDPEPAHAAGRPPRKYYRLTMEGRTRAIHALQKCRERSGLSLPLTQAPTTEAGPA